MEFPPARPERKPTPRESLDLIGSQLKKIGPTFEIFVDSIEDPNHVEENSKYAFWEKELVIKELDAEGNLINQIDFKAEIIEACDTLATKISEYAEAENWHLLTTAIAAAYNHLRALDSLIESYDDEFSTLRKEITERIRKILRDLESVLSRLIHEPELPL